MPSGIFISYRRYDSQHATARFVDQLCHTYSRDQVFFDVESIAVGLDYPSVIRDQLGRCQVLLVIIGRNWLTAADDDGTRRLDDPADHVRCEIEAGLARGMRVVPVLVDGAALPREEELPESLKPLADRQKFDLRHEQFAIHAGALVDHLLQFVKPTDISYTSSQIAYGKLILGVVLLLVGSVLLAPAVLVGIVGWATDIVFAALFLTPVGAVLIAFALKTLSASRQVVRISGDDLVVKDFFGRSRLNVPLTAVLAARVNRKRKSAATQHHFVSGGRGVEVTAAGLPLLLIGSSDADELCASIMKARDVVSRMRSGG